MLPRPLLPIVGDPAGSALFFDVDGTLAPITQHPALTEVPAETLAGLGRLAARYGMVGVVSGRSLETLRRLVPVPGVVFGGNHGLELDDGGGPRLAAEVERWLPTAHALAKALRHDVELAGAWVEDKGPTLTIHWREAADPAATEAAIMPRIRLAAERAHFVLKPARMAVELRPPLPLNKGTAVLALTRSRPIRTSLFCGDDITDIDGFRVVDVAVAVFSPEMPRPLLDTADLVVDSGPALIAQLDGAD